MNIPQRRSSNLRGLTYLLNRWVLRRSFLNARLPELNLQFRVKTEDVVGRHIYKYHVHEPDLSAFLVRNLHFEPDDVVIDIGGNIGWYSMLLSRLAPGTVDIYAFEPDPLNFQLLTDNVVLNNAENVHPVQCALAAEEGARLLYKHDSNNLGRHSLIELQDGESVEVKTRTLDKFWEQTGLGDRRPRFIKIDIEGYEYFALSGGTDVLQRCPQVLCEFSPEYMRAGGIEPSSLVDLLMGLGFSPNLVDETGLNPVSRKFLLAVDRVVDLFWQKPDFADQIAG